MKLRKLSPVVALIGASAFFAFGSLAGANATPQAPEASTPTWVQEELTQEEALLLWGELVEDGSTEGDLSEVPGLLTLPDEGHLVHIYERGLVENLAARYERCSGLDVAAEAGEPALEKEAATTRRSFGNERGVAGILDTEEYFDAIDQVAADEDSAPGDVELQYFCSDVIGGN